MTALRCIKVGCECEATVGAYCAKHFAALPGVRPTRPEPPAALIIAALVIIALLGPVLTLASECR